MFGTNERVGRGYFEKSNDPDHDHLLVTSAFMTLQGEGPFSGCPAFFLRLTKCNLACSFCDTYFNTGDWLTFDEVNDLIKETIHKHYSVVPHWADRWPGHKRQMVLVITGGEPSLQVNVSAFVTSMLATEFEDVQIESNGILLLPELPDECYLVVSPKCEDGITRQEKYLTPHAAMLDRADCLKFVMDGDPSSAYAHIPIWAHEWRERTDKPVFVSPMNHYLKQPDTSLGNMRQRTEMERVSFWTPGLLDWEKNQRSHEYAAEYCIRHGFRLSLQQHLYASLP